MNELLVTLEMPQETAETCIKAIEVESINDVHERSKVELKYGGGLLVILVRAHDLTSMRASFNTYLRWINMCAGLIGGKNK